MIDMLEEADALKRLIGRKPTTAHFTIAERALGSKWEGNQSLAVQALQAWGGRQAAHTVRTFLEAAFERKTAWAIRGVAIKALVTMIGIEDAHWIEALHHSRPSAVERHELRPLVERLTKLRSGQ